MKSKYLLEIATSDFESTKNAVIGGADRIELCANLGEGGTTQSYGVIKKCRELFDVKLYPIIRIRGGDFLYTEEEFNCMMNDVLMCKELGCDGVVIGFLNINGTIDVERTKKMVETAYPMGVTFHRAFDRCADPYTALEQIISAGCERILTSGQKTTAPEGVALIKELNVLAKDRIIIMPGSGVRSENIKQLAIDTGCYQFHTSLRKQVQSPMKFIAPAFEYDKESYTHYTVIAQDVITIKKELLS